MKKVKLLLSYNLLLIDMSRLIPMNKTLLDVDKETLNPNNISQPYVLIQYLQQPEGTPSASYDLLNI